MHYTLAIRATQGARRAQEDCALAWPAAGTQADPFVTLPPVEPGVVAAVLCDGMGGHAGGAMASRLACEHSLPVLAGRGAPLQERLLAAAETANASIAVKAAASPAYADMGTTLVGVYLDKAGLSWVSVGDSLLYLIRNGDLITLNADHSLAPEIDKLAEGGRISWEEARNDPRRHYLRSALTGDDIELIDVSPEPQPLREGDVVIVASDGIHSLDKAAIAAIVSEISPPDPAVIAQRLVAAVDDAGVEFQDNATIIAICVSGVPAGSKNV